MFPFLVLGVQKNKLTLAQTKCYVKQYTKYRDYANHPYQEELNASINFPIETFSRKKKKRENPDSYFFCSSLR
jgi:hypothetical protein